MERPIVSSTSHTGALGANLSSPAFVSLDLTRRWKMEEVKRDIKCTNSQRAKCVAGNIMESVLINTREASGTGWWYLLLDGNSALRVELQLQPSVSAFKHVHMLASA